jgi:hypothetical protein
MDERSAPKLIALLRELEARNDEKWAEIGVTGSRSAIIFGTGATLQLPAAYVKSAYAPGGGPSSGAQILRQRTRVAIRNQAKVPSIATQKQAGHVPGTPQHAVRLASGKPTSTFFDASQAKSVTLEAWQKGTPLGTDGKMRLYEFGRPIGVKPGGGGYQTQVRVSMDAKGRIHGTPWGRVYEGAMP